MIADSPIVQEVRERAHRISERFGHDLKEYAKHLKQIEKQHTGTVVSQITVVATKARRSRDADDDEQ